MSAPVVSKSLLQPPRDADDVHKYTTKSSDPVLREMREKFNFYTTSAVGFNVKHYGAIGDGVANDTQAIADTIAAAFAAGGTIFFPAGTYLTDPIDMQLFANSDISFQGEGKYGFIGGSGSRIKLRTPSAFLFQVIGLRLKWSDLTIDGGGIADTVIIFQYLTTEFEFNHVNITGCVPVTGLCIDFQGTLEISNGVFRRCRIAPDVANNAVSAFTCIKNFNANAFNIAFEYCYIANADFLVHMSQGSCDFRHCEMFFWNVNCFRIETYAQQHEIDDIYFEQTAGVFYNQVFNAGGVTSRPGTLRNLQLNGSGGISLIGTQPMFLENVVTATNITFNPVPDVAKTGTVSCTNGSPNIPGIGTTFTTEFIPGSWVKIHGEIRQVLSITDDLNLILTKPMNTTAGPGLTIYLAYGFNRVTAHNVRFSVLGTGFIGTGYPSQVDEYHSVYNTSTPISSVQRLPWKGNALGPDADRVTNPITMEDGDEIFTPTLTGNHTYRISIYNRPTFYTQTFSVVGAAAGAFTLTIQNEAGVAIAVLSAVAGTLGWVDVWFTGSTCIVLRKGNS